jgi:hypothetical protein
MEQHWSYLKLIGVQWLQRFIQQIHKMYYKAISYYLNADFKPIYDA